MDLSLLDMQRGSFALKQVVKNALRKFGAGHRLALSPALFVKAIRPRCLQRSVLAEVPVQIPMEMCVGFTGFPFGRRGWHYLTEQLRQYDRNPAIQIEDTILFRLHQQFQPGGSFHLIASHGQNVRFRPPLGILPWGNFRSKWLPSNAQDKDWTRSRWYGPTPIEVVKDEFQHMIETYKSIKQNGYDPWHRSFIGGTFLRRSTGELRYVVLQGNHRTAIMSYLGYDSIVARCPKGYECIIDEQEAMEWTFVKAEQCSMEDALAYFNAYFVLTGFEQGRKTGLIE